MENVSFEKLQYIKTFFDLLKHASEMGRDTFAMHKKAAIMLSEVDHSCQMDITPSYQVSLKGLKIPREWKYVSNELQALQSIQEDDEGNFDVFTTYILLFFYVESFPTHKQVKLFLGERYKLKNFHSNYTTLVLEFRLLRNMWDDEGEMRRYEVAGESPLIEYYHYNKDRTIVKKSALMGKQRIKG